MIKVLEYGEEILNLISIKNYLNLILKKEVYNLLIIKIIIF